MSGINGRYVFGKRLWRRDYRGMYKEAAKAFRQAIIINPDDAMAHSDLGYLYALLNDRDSALEQYKILKSLDPEHVEELYNMIY